MPFSRGAVLLRAAMVGQTVRFTRQNSVEETWGVMQPLLDTARAVHKKSVTASV